MTAQLDERPLKICLYTNRALPKNGGQEAVVDALARELIALGQGVVVLAPGMKRLFRQIDRTLPYQVIRHPRFFSTRWFVSWYQRFLLRTHRAHRFDIIHCHGAYPAGYLGALCRSQINVPLVVTDHSGNLESDPTWIGSSNLREKHLYAFESADALIALSQHTADLLHRLVPGQRNIVRIPNGVDFELLGSPQPNQGKLAGAIIPGTYILTLGRLRHSKGVDLLIRVLPQLIGLDRLSLVVGGTGRERHQLQTLALQLGVQDRVTFVGWISGSLKAFLLQNALCAVVPSREAEGFGLVPLESYAAGRPVIASRVPGLCELISHGNTGLFFEPDSVESLSQALRTLIADRALADRMGVAGKTFAQSYRWRTVADRHLQLYCSLRNATRTCGQPPEHDPLNHDQPGDLYASLAHS
jgi:glycosyltransferase involved in cell wall biosynthesis